MHSDKFKEHWHHFKGKLKEKWGKLTDDDLMQINGKREQLLGRLQSHYGWDKNRAENELTNFEDTCRCCEDRGEMSEDKEEDFDRNEGQTRWSREEGNMEYERGEGQRANWGNEERQGGYEGQSRFGGNEERSSGSQGQNRFGRNEGQERFGQNQGENRGNKKNRNDRDEGKGNNQRRKAG